MYRETFIKVFNAYTEIKDAKLTFIDLYNLQRTPEKEWNTGKLKTSDNYCVLLQVNLEKMLKFLTKTFTIN